MGPDQRFMRGYILISLVLAVFDLIYVVICLRKKERTATFLGLTALGGALVDLTYLVSILTKDYFVSSLFSSAYFASIDWMLLCMVGFTNLYTRREYSRRWAVVKLLLVVYAVFETVIFAVNPFWEIALSYVRSDRAFAVFSYEMKPLYVVHLVYSYALTLYSLGVLALRAFQAPKQYRNQYSYIIFGVLALVAINALFLYTPVGEWLPHLDYSICGYSLILMLMYWSCFEYTRTEMLKGLSVTIIDNIGQGIVLFDYEGFLVMKNDRAAQLLGSVSFRDRMPEERFLSQFNFPIRHEDRDSAFSVQCYQKRNDRELAVRCDFRPLTDDNGQRLGSLYVFTDAELETDLLTGFHKLKAYKKFAAENTIKRKKAVAVFDINALGMINSARGVEEGDRQIRLLAAAMRKCFPAESYFIRGSDAVLIVWCYDLDADTMRRYAEQVQQTFGESVQFAVSETSGESGDSVAAINDAIHALQTKKLLDKNSAHSQALTSLVRALQECDSDTEAHVQRTQTMGRELGCRIGLSDSEQSDLQLLCLLHDIGKIGIPLDLLHKPAKLTEDEWAIIQSHVEKGYQIAKSSDKFSCIADMILHHHERWDGKGYPSGLSRESIPLLSRIIAVVDAFDAMTNDRPYQKACSVNEALEEIRRCAGSQFDPRIAAEFIRMIREKHGIELAPAPVQRKTPKAIDPRKVEDAAAAANVYPVRFAKYLLDDGDRIVDADPAFTELTGYTEQDWRDGKLHQLDLIPQEERAEYAALVTAQLAQSTTVYLEHRLQTKDGRRMFVLCYSEKIYDSAAKARRTRIVITDVAKSQSARLISSQENSKSEKQLMYWEKIYRRDAMTGLLNHVAFQNEVEQLLLNEERRLVLIMIDVDFFKGFNDQYGHDAGDTLLVALAKSLKDSTRKQDLLCRMGGDEFAVVLPISESTTNGQIRQRTEQVFRAAYDAVSQFRGNSGISAGAVISHESTEEFKTLYRAADQALYHAKRNGRGRLVFAEDLPQESV